MSLWVLGTDTGVGKTVVSALVLHRYMPATTLRYWKPVSTGGDDDRDRTTISQWIDPGIDLLEETYLFGLPASPHLAARTAGAEIDPERILQDYRRHGSSPSPLVIEGAGGVMVPLTDHHLLIDTVAATALPVVLVARSTLGTINHTLLTLEALRSRDVPVLGVVLNGPRHEENARAIRICGETPVVSEVLPIQKALTRTSIAETARRFDPEGLLAPSLGASP